MVVFLGFVSSLILMRKLFLKIRFFCPSLQGDGALQVKSAGYH
jgi:hypothetical protein